MKSGQPDQNELFERFTTICKDAGLKLTHQRLEVYKELAFRNDHPSAEDVFQVVKTRIPTIALDTVYRTLSTFANIGAVARVDAFDDRARFDANLTPHHHCICTRCRSIKDFKWETFDVMNPPDDAWDWGILSSKQIVFRGLCRECLQKGAVESD